MSQLKLNECLLRISKVCFVLVSTVIGFNSVFHYTSFEGIDVLRTCSDDGFHLALCHENQAIKQNIA